MDLDHCIKLWWWWLLLLLRRNWWFAYFFAFAYFSVVFC